MINFTNKADINWSKTKIGILGGGKSGIAAAKLGRYIKAQIFISDLNTNLYFSIFWSLSNNFG